jgi:spore maturation protein CgeB
MRIFTAVKHSTDPKFYYGGLWSANFYPALRQLGHEVVESQVDLLPASKFMDVARNFKQQELEIRARITEGIIDEVKQAHSKRPIDLFLSYFYNSHFDPLAFDDLDRLGIPSVNFFCNAIFQFDWVADIAPKATFSWHPEKETQKHYLKAGANPVWVQMGADPDVYHPVPEVARLPKACFVGQRYCDRDRWLASLVRHGVPVDIYGVGWLPQRNGTVTKQVVTSHETGVRHTSKPGTISAYLAVVRENIGKNGWLGGGVRTLKQSVYTIQSRRLHSSLQPYAKEWAKDLSEVFAKYEVVLNFSNVWADGRSGSPLIPWVRLRDFEAPMSRACYLTGYTDEIAEFYELGKEIDTYKGPEELIEKTHYYLKHPAEAEKLRQAGYRRAKRDHTWVRRFEDLFRNVIK